MKHDILECMDRGLWYCVETLSALTGYANRQTRDTCMLLVGEGLLDMSTLNEKRRFRLAMTKRASRQPDYTCVPTTATARYRPRWAPLEGYGAANATFRELAEMVR
ncbi:hypothetical protein [Pandoraea sputorum]|uniref:hypothetical protein n=1 Tax=Pandoraea sputorum TaxID=93222 RepID=UPI0012424B7B|nr:hypothetical protein [Pandoraea sputorum]VVE06937.1 hypothetical protein PSP20601_02443 [Pandoraea sputorum]